MEVQALEFKGDYKNLYFDVFARERFQDSSKFKAFTLYL
jgi:hypothetical protein